jgi:hypothetical protein
MLVLFAASPMDAEPQNIARGIFLEHEYFIIIDDWVLGSWEAKAYSPPGVLL